MPRHGLRDCGGYPLSRRASRSSAPSGGRAEPQEADARSRAAPDAEAWPPELWVVPPQPASEPFFGARRSPEDVLVAEEGDVLLGYARLGRHLPVEANAHALDPAAL